MARTKTTYAMPVDPEWLRAALAGYDSAGRGEKGKILPKQTIGNIKGESRTFDSLEKLRLALRDAGLADLPLVVAPMRSREHHRWTLAGVSVDTDLLEWVEVGRRLQAVGKLHDAIDAVCKMTNTDRSPLSDDSVDGFFVSRSNSAALRTDNDDARPTRLIQTSMGRAVQHTEADDADLLEWVKLAERLRAANPRGLRRALRLFQEIVEGQELLAQHDHQLVLRRRPTKRYHG